jgi:hypothetical protein
MTDTYSQLSKALASTLAAAEAVGDAELSLWARLELLGWAEPVMTTGMVVPEYRTVGGHWVDDYGRRLNITDPNLSFINEIRLRKGVVELETFLGMQGIITMRALDMAEIFNSRLGVEVTSFQFTPQSVTQLLATIRAQLMDRIVAHRKQLERSEQAKPPPPGGSSSDILQLKPSIYGIGIDLRALWRRFQSRG